MPKPWIKIHREDPQAWVENEKDRSAPYWKKRNTEWREEKLKRARDKEERRYAGSKAAHTAYLKEKEQIKMNSNQYGYAGRLRRVEG